MIRIDHALCDECGTCISVCPKNVIVLTDKLCIIKDGCLGCGICVSVCPVGALCKEQ